MFSRDEIWNLGTITKCTWVVNDKLPHAFTECCDGNHRFFFELDQTSEDHRPPSADVADSGGSWTFILNN